MLWVIAFSPIFRRRIFTAQVIKNKPSVELRRRKEGIPAISFDTVRSCLKMDAPLVGIDKNKLEKFGNISFYATKDKIYVDAYHPAQWATASKEDYSNDIILTVKNWYENGLEK